MIGFGITGRASPGATSNLAVPRTSAAPQLSQQQHAAERSLTQQTWLADADLLLTCTVTPVHALSHTLRCTAVTAQKGTKRGATPQPGAHPTCHPPSPLLSALLLSISPSSTLCRKHSASTLRHPPSTWDLSDSVSHSPWSIAPTRCSCSKCLHVTQFTAPARPLPSAAWLHTGSYPALNSPVARFQETQNSCRRSPSACAAVPARCTQELSGAAPADSPAV
jgi:hypothetical protein